MPVALVKVADDFPLSRSRAANRVVFRCVDKRASWFHSGTSSGAGLVGCGPEPELGSLIDAKNNSFVGWIEIQTDHVGQLFEKLRIARQLTYLRAMRLDPLAGTNGAGSSMNGFRRASGSKEQKAFHFPFPQGERPGRFPPQEGRCPLVHPLPVLTMEQPANNEPKNSNLTSVA